MQGLRYAGVAGDVVRTGEQGGQSAWGARKGYKLHHHLATNSSVLQPPPAAVQSRPGLSARDSIHPERESAFAVLWPSIRMPRMRVKRGHAVVDSYNEAIRAALARNPNFVQTPTCREAYMGTGIAQASNPLSTPTASADMGMGADSMQAAPLPQRRQRLMPSSVDDPREGVSATNRRRTRKPCKQRPPRVATFRDRHGRLVDVQLLSSDSEGSAGSERGGGGRPGAAPPPCRTSVYKFADDDLPPTNDASSAQARDEIRPASTASQAAVSKLTTPRARPRKSICPERSPIL